MKMKNLDRYPAEVFWSDEDEGFIATAPDLPGCSAFGDTQVEALAELDHAIVAWKEAALAAGNPVPPPSKPAQTEYSGKFVVRMAKSMHAQLAVAAHREGVSLNQYVVTLLATSGSLRSMQTAFEAFCTAGRPSGSTWHSDYRLTSNLHVQMTPYGEYDKAGGYISIENLETFSTTGTEALTSCILPFSTLTQEVSHG
jgi:predicted RNase H-like HicB family nuclease